MEHPLKKLRVTSGCTQLEIARRSGISATRLSLAENFIVSLTDQEMGSIENAVVAATKERTGLVLAEADPRLRLAMKTIESRPSAKKLFASLKESRGYSDVEAAVFVLGVDYPK